MNYYYSYYCKLNIINYYRFKKEFLILKEAFILIVSELTTKQDTSRKQIAVELIALMKLYDPPIKVFIVQSVMVHVRVPSYLAIGGKKLY